MNKISGIAVLVVVLLGGAWLFENQAQSSATISDTEIVRSSVQAETVEVGISVDNGAIATFTLENMAPGDEFRGEIVIENKGSLPVIYGVTSVAGPSPLNQFLELNIWNGFGNCSTTDLPATKIFSGAFSVAVRDVVGVGTTKADFRPLAVGESEALCAQVILPLSAGNEAQNQITKQSFTVLAIHDLE